MVTPAASTAARRSSGRAAIARRERALLHCGRFLHKPSLGSECVYERAFMCVGVFNVCVVCGNKRPGQQSLHYLDLQGKPPQLPLRAPQCDEVRSRNGRRSAVRNVHALESIALRS